MSLDMLNVTFNNLPMNNQIKNLRLKMGMSRHDFAAQLKVSYGAICNYEYGSRSPRREICYRIIDLAKKHGIKIELEDIYPRFD